MELYVRNWRCIEEVRVQLKPITLFIGKNATGKSSLAYAAYFLAKIVEWKDVNEVLSRLYGVDLNGIVRSDGDKRFYPVIIEVNGARFEARDSNSFNILNSSPWKDCYLLPSQRLSFIRLFQFIPRLIREILKKGGKSFFAYALAYSIFESLKIMPLMPPSYLFLEGLMKIYLGRSFIKRHGLNDVGALIVKTSPLLTLIVFEYADPYTKLTLPLDLAPDGFVDSALITMIVDKVPENSLVVIEEPEIHKNPLQIISLVKNIALKAVEKRLTLIMTSHSDIVVKALLKAIEEKSIGVEHLAVYYFERSPEHPWTRVRELKVYEDGTIEELPDVEKVISMLF